MGDRSSPSAPDSNPFSLHSAPRIIEQFAHDPDGLRRKSRQFANSITVGAHGAPGSEKLRAHWSLAFAAYMRDVQSRSADHRPTVDDIIRFMDTIAGCIKGRQSSSGTSSAPSYTTIVDAVRSVRSVRWYCEVTFRDWKLDKRENDLIRSVFHTLEQTGAITKEPKTEKQRILSTLVHRMSFEMIKAAAIQGCQSWDIRRQQVLAITLQSALGCRAGDIREADIGLGTSISDIVMS